VNKDWEHPLPKSSSPRIASFTMSLSPFDFDVITPSKSIARPPPKMYVAVVATPVNKQVENIKKVYSEKMAKLDRDFIQEAKRYESEEKQMKYVITQLVRQKQELEEKLAKITLLLALITKPSTLSKPTHSSPTLKKPNSSNVKIILLKHPKEALTLKTPFFIKFNQIQIEKIETKTFNTLTPRQGDIIQKEISEINKLEINTPSSLTNEIQNNFPTPEPLSQTNKI
jgi:hypothetical protein